MATQQDETENNAKMPGASFAAGFYAGALGGAAGICTIFSILALSPDVSLDTAKVMGVALSLPISMAAYSFTSRELSVCPERT